MMSTRKLVSLVALLLATATSAFAQKFEGLAMTPPMGWNSWNTFEIEISEDLVMGIAQTMIDSGMRDAGYTYIVLDDGWMLRERDENGNLVPDPEKFPNGIKHLADWLHERGFKFGLYNCAGSKTCAGFPGSQGHEFQDARLYASWDIDYLKYDWCNTDTRNAKEAYTTMSRAIREAGRPMIFSLCEWGGNKPWEWAKDVGHLWRTTGDIIDMYEGSQQWSNGVKTIIDMQHDLGVAPYAGPDHWNDPDMMEVGNPGLTLAESRMHFSIWCMLAAPLIAGNDLTVMSDEITAILTNKEAIAIDQDPMGKQGARFLKTPEMEVYYRELSGGDWAVCVMNASGETRETTFDLNNIYTQEGRPQGDFIIKDIWADKVLGKKSENSVVSKTLESHDVILLRLSHIKE